MTIDKNPWMKFYPQDWRSDEKLRMCSIGARGLWVELLCLMHRSERYGYLLVSGKVPTDNALAIICGVSSEQFTGLLGELEQVDVFSRNSQGIIFSRRMVKDHKKSNVNRKNVKKRWNARKTDADQSTEPVDKNTSGNTKSLRTVLPHKKPEARSQNKDSKKDYYWSAQTIKLNKRDYLAWRDRYGGTDEQFMAWLESRDGWYQAMPPEVRRNWFVATGNALAKIMEDA